MKGDSSDIKHYRPVTVPYSFSKCFEYYFLKRLISYIEQTQIVFSTQYGFRSNLSTSTAIANFYNKLMSCRQGVLVAIFCDLSRAFDCVHVDLLIIKLSKYKWYPSPLAEKLSHKDKLGHLYFSKWS